MSESPATGGVVVDEDANRAAGPVLLDVLDAVGPAQLGLVGDSSPVFPILSSARYPWPWSAAYAVASIGPV